MRKIRILVASAAAMLGIVGATGSYARGCSPEPYMNGPTPNVTGDVAASQNLQMFTTSYINSPSGNYQLVFQGDGNLVLYTASHSAVWASYTQVCVPNSNNVGYATFQTDGNLVIYAFNRGTSTYNAVWASNTNGHPNAVLSVQDDGNMVIYDGGTALWSTRFSH